MTEHQPPMTQTMKASEAKQHWGSLLTEVFKRQKRVLVEKSGIPVAAVISAEDLERFEHLEAQRGRDFAILDEIGEAFQDQTPEQIERGVTQAVAAARNQMRREETPTRPSAPSA